MIDHATPEPVPQGDFAPVERTEIPAPVSPAPAMQGDFAAGERTDIPTPEELLEEGLHGDFAAGGRTEPLTQADDTPGTFADSK